MIRPDVKVTGQPTAAQLADFKVFGAFNGAETDAYLTGLLRAGMIAVQEWADTTLLATTVTMTVTEREDTLAPITLLLSGIAIESVKDENGEALDYKFLGHQVLVPAPAKAVVITYNATPTEGAALEALLLKAWRYAAAKYDGDPAPDINRIAAEI